MANTYTIRLESNDLGQALDGLRCREAAWRNTARYLETGESPIEFFLAEECRDAEEARSIAEHYQRIIASIETQMEAQR
jgi:hypothetical protein